MSLQKSEFAPTRGSYRERLNYRPQSCSFKAAAPTWSNCLVACFEGKKPPQTQVQGLPEVAVVLAPGGEQGGSGEGGVLAGGAGEGGVAPMSQLT
ncbi:hypothetical protein TSOC_011754 [Tetrabaena socialis]|uniref:Uncharacterized protein n=1 Tax=Tetrabaena socialis TaxID=47790 RepID=A0A2J7ZPS9_9CHLO|nr:hypothetical protein TSOC_011754 [Tetrabaena socialis]|eukprot:PNH02278.1 hypothetical protein TSOC_011754 [Tetrabaena socialis]